MILLSASKKGSSELTDKVARAATSMSTAATMILLASSEERSSELADEVARASASVRVLASSSERIERETLIGSLVSAIIKESGIPYSKAAGALASRSIDASRAVADIRSLCAFRLIVRVRAVRGRAGM